MARAAVLCAARGKLMSSYAARAATQPLLPGLRYRRTYAALEAKCPSLVPVERWQRCVADARTFLERWGERAELLGWDSRDLFGLVDIPERPSPRFDRLGRYDCTRLVWLWQGRAVVGLTADAATIRNPSSGSITVYRKHNKPALGPLGDSLEYFK